MAETTDRVPHVDAQLVEPTESARVAMGESDLLHASDRLARFDVRVLRRHPASLVLVLEQREMRRDFTRDVCVAA
jgi:hypothetical protein